MKLHLYKIKALGAPESENDCTQSAQTFKSTKIFEGPEGPSECGKVSKPSTEEQEQACVVACRPSV